MKFATLGHLDIESRLQQIPKEWIHHHLIVSPEINCNGTKGYVLALQLTAQQMMSIPVDEVRKQILDAAVFAQTTLGVDVLQLGALTTSVTSGGSWLAEQKQYTGFVNHGDSYTAAATCQAVGKALHLFKKEVSQSTLAIVGAYGVIGEAVSKLLVPQFSHSILIGRRKEKFKTLVQHLKGNFETTTELQTKDADIIVTATSHPTALLTSQHLRKQAIVVDVSQPPNLSFDVVKQRPDLHRIDGGIVDFPAEHGLVIPGVPPGKNFACIVEVIMQAMENERNHHVGSIDLKHLLKTEQWAQKYGFTLNELTNFGTPIKL